MNQGCSQCESGSFKLSNNHPCVSCNEYFGDSCVQCNDYQGCTQCSPSNDFTLAYDTNSNIRYCEPSPCIDDDNNCIVCNNGFCSQCAQGYTINPDQKSCS